jgi:hypothetical protein
LVEKIWSGQSVLSAWEDLYDLTFVRWDKHQEWSPWNCILLTKDEAASHVRLVDLDEVSLIHTCYYYCENKLWCNFLFYIEKSASIILKTNISRLLLQFFGFTLKIPFLECLLLLSVITYSTLEINVLKQTPIHQTIVDNLHLDRSNTMDGSN